MQVDQGIEEKHYLPRQVSLPSIVLPSFLRSLNHLSPFLHIIPPGHSCHLTMKREEKEVIFLHCLPASSPHCNACDRFSNLISILHFPVGSNAAFTSFRSIDWQSENYSRERFSKLLFSLPIIHVNEKAVRKDR